VSRRTIVLTVSVALAFFGAGLASGRLVYGGRVNSSLPSATTVAPAPTHAENPVGVLVPDLSGATLREAVRVLTALGLEVGELQARRDPSAEEVVLSQGSSPGSRLDPGQAVPLVLSAGPHPVLVVIGGGRRAGVGGTCDLVVNPHPLCIGGPLFVPFLES